MKYKNRDYKTMARDALGGNYGAPIAGILLVNLGTMMINSITSYLFRGSGVMTIVISQIFAFGITLIMNIFVAGLMKMYLEIARYQPFSMGNLLHFFKNNPDRVIVAGFFLGLIREVTSIPLYWVNYGVPVAEDNADSLMNWLMLMSGAMLVQLVLELLLTLPFVMTYMILCDREDLSGIQALRESARIMKGAKGKYLLLLVSFLPFFLICAVTCYIAVLWVLPYLNVAECFFYRDLIQELGFHPQPPGDQEVQGRPGLNDRHFQG